MGINNDEPIRPKPKLVPRPRRPRAPANILEELDQQIKNLEEQADQRSYPRTVATIIPSRSIPIINKRNEPINIEKTYTWSANLYDNTLIEETKEKHYKKLKKDVLFEQTSLMYIYMSSCAIEYCVMSTLYFKAIFNMIGQVRSPATGIIQFILGSAFLALFFWTLNILNIQKERVQELKTKSSESS
jgi:hypothetical protein